MKAKVLKLLQKVLLLIAVESAVSPSQIGCYQCEATEELKKFIK